MSRRAGERVAVVGGGVIGLSCAVNLLRLGRDVVVFDTAVAQPASWGNAGHIATEQVEPIASPKALRSTLRRLFIGGGPLDFRWADIGVWGPWALRYLQASRPEPFANGCIALGGLLKDAAPAWRRLVATLGAPELLQEEGHYVLWESPASSTAGQRAWATVDTGRARFRAVDLTADQELPGALKAQIAGAVRFEGSGQIRDLTRLQDALRQTVTGMGGEIRKTPVEALMVTDQKVRAVLQGGENVAEDQIIIAAGVKSGVLMRQAGHLTPVIAERGYHIEGEAGVWPMTAPLVFEDRSMIVTRFANRLRAASFVEFASPDSPPDHRKWRRLERHIRELGLPMGEPRSRWMGARPTLPDYLPAIGVSRRATNLIYAFGHQHLGLTLAAVTGEIVARLASGEAESIPLSPFDIDRFAKRYDPHAARPIRPAHGLSTLEFSETGKVRS